FRMSGPAVPFGTFSWLVLSTSEMAGAVAFYRRLFGWLAVPMPPNTLMVQDGKPVAILIDHAKSPILQDPKVKKEPVNWLPYVRVGSVDRVLQRAVSAGGSVLIPPLDVDLARMAVIRGATGEAVGLWQTPAKEGGDTALMDRETCAWFELVTPDPERAMPFYRAVFGWRIADEGGYTFIGNETGQFGGVVKLEGDWEDHAFLAAIGRVSGNKLKVPPHWMVFFRVDDCDSFVDAAENLGAQVTGRPEPLHTVGTFAVIRDPQGVYFSVLSAR
ncbi:MAG TPA: VOC family protein, partial [Polyangiaceae bacterium]|nr:VOC family protein [Polyangiaceae bacterium]